MKNKILLVRNDNIGDLVCTTPAIEALRKKYPDAKIDIVVNSYNFLAIRNNPFIDNIYIYTKPKHKKNISNKIVAALGKLKILKDVKKEGYDIAIVFRSSYSKSAEFFSKISGARKKIGIKNKNGKDGFNIHIPFNGNEHEVEFCLNCLKPLGIKYNNEKPIFFVEDEITKKFSNYCGKIGFHISARMKKNKMSYNKLYQILSNIKEKIYITSDPSDIEMAKKLQKETSCIYIPTASLLELAGLIKNLGLFVTLEGGAMHLSPALGTKTIALFGYSPIDRWHPWGYKGLVIQDKSKIAENIDNKLIIDKIEENYED